MSNYRRGADFERRVRDRLEEKGYFVVRSAGSRTPVDLVAVPRDGGPNLFIQCKSGKTKMTGRERVELLDFALEHHAIAVIFERGMQETILGLPEAA